MKYNELRKWYWQEKPSRTIFSDASNSGWSTTSGNNKTGGTFSLEENKNHINANKLLEAKFALRTFVNIESTHVKLMSNNTTTAYGIDNMCCNNSDLYNQIVFDIWSCTEKSNIWITAAYIPRKENSDSGGESRKKQKDLE